MKESDIQGPASQDGPESCACSRETARKALTGVHMGGVLSRENRCNQGADDVVLIGRQYADGRHGEPISNPARSETSSTCGNSMRENREIPCPPPGDGTGGRAGKVDDRNPAMHGHGKSDIHPATKQAGREDFAFRAAGKPPRNGRHTLGVPVGIVPWHSIFSSYSYPRKRLWGQLRAQG